LIVSEVIFVMASEATTFHLFFWLFLSTDFDKKHKIRRRHVTKYINSKDCVTFEETVLKLLNYFKSTELQ
jgi:hypothetical protein